MADDARDPAAYAADIEAARDRLVSFVSSCADREWRAAPLDGDPRPVAVVVDHVAHAYEYMAGWISQLVAGQPTEVSSQTVDTLNAQHAQAAAAVTKAEVTEHLRRSGDAISRLVASLHAADLAAGDGMVQRLARIAARHADDHRTDIQAALTARGAGHGLYLATRDARSGAVAVGPSSILVRSVGLLVSRARTAVLQRGADVPGRTLDGGQATDDRNDRAVLADRLARFREVSGILGGLGGARLFVARQARLLLGRR